MKSFKKICCGIIAATTLFCCSALSAVADSAIKVTLNGALINFDVQPQIINSRTMVPLRAIFEALGASVEWDEDTKTITSKKDNTSISLTINNPIMYVNGKSVSLDSPATIVSGRTLVPVRAISEAYGTNVDWQGDTKTVVIITNDSNAENTIEYIDISANVKQINNFINMGMYPEAIAECKTLKSGYSLSPNDEKKIDELQNSAQTAYDQYIIDQQNQTTDVSANIKQIKNFISWGKYSEAIAECKSLSGYNLTPTDRETINNLQRQAEDAQINTNPFNKLKDHIIKTGEYDAQSNQYKIIELLSTDGGTIISYNLSKDTIGLFLSMDSGNSNSSMLITLNKNKDHDMILTFEYGSSKYTLFSSYSSTGKLVTLNDTFPSALKTNRDKMLNSMHGVIDATIKLTGAGVSLSDFGISYTKS